MTAPGPYPPPTSSFPPPGEGAAPPPRSRPADVTITIVLIVVLALLGLLSLTLGLFFVMASDGCSDEACTNRVALGVLVIELAPIVAWVPTTAWAIVRMMRRKVAFWVPLLAIPVYVVVAFAGLMFLRT